MNDYKTRARMSAASKAAWANRNPDLAGLGPRQLAIYRTLRRKGCTRAEALHEAQRACREAAE